MQYFLVEGGIIQRGPMGVPSAWRNISGLHLLSDPELIALGWLPQVVIGFEPFDPDTQKRSGPINLVKVDSVESTFVVTNKTAQEIDDEKEAKADAQLMSGLASLAKGIADVQLNTGRFIVPSDMPAVATATKAHLKAAL